MALRGPAALMSDGQNAQLRGHRAEKVRALITQNDPDAVRTGLREIAAALDQLAGCADPQIRENRLSRLVHQPPDIVHRVNFQDTRHVMPSPAG
jgi:hypothetical protein